MRKKANIPVDSAFTYENDVITWVASIFIDIENSSVYLKRKTGLNIKPMPIYHLNYSWLKNVNSPANN